ncbi:exopolysaccharide biosynthesis protein [Salipiger abyssi]|uniref:exopolysaccharide biosynthesis protein n=1 Tax=Salipiger abyssi TaxID=1250539 RepID=UPI00405A3029
MTAQDRPRPVGEIVDRLQLAVDRERVPLRALLEVFGESSFLPALMVPALLVVSPLSGIPLFSTICGLSIAFISAQMLISRSHLWLPDILLRQQMDGATAQTALGKLRYVSDWIDAHSKRRFRMLTSAPFRKWLQLLCFLCGAVMPFLELVPFSSSLLGGAVLLMATALLARDGLFALLGSMAICLAVFVPLSVLGIV